MYPTDGYSIARQTATSKDALWRNSGISIYTYICTIERETRKKDEFTEKKREANEREWENW